MAQLNCNDHVWVRLTDEGRRIYDAAEARFPEVARIPLVEVDGWSKWQLWCLMQAFGGRMFNGCAIPFVDNVISLEPPK